MRFDDHDSDAQDAAGDALAALSRAETHVYSFGQYELHPRRRLLTEGGDPVRLGARALDILIVLVEQAGEVVTKDKLIAQVWPDIFVEDSNLRVHIAGLRKALGEGQDGARYIVNVPGRGYSFVAPVVRALDLSRAQPAVLGRYALAGVVAHLSGGHVLAVLHDRAVPSTDLPRTAPLTQS